MVIQRDRKKPSKIKRTLPSLQEPKHADSEMAGKYATLSFTASLYNDAEDLGEARLTERNSAQRLEEALARDD